MLAIFYLVRVVAYEELAWQRKKMKEKQSILSNKHPIEGINGEESMTNIRKKHFHLHLDFVNVYLFNSDWFNHVSYYFILNYTVR